MTFIIHYEKKLVDYSICAYLFIMISVIRLKMIKKTISIFVVRFLGRYWEMVERLKLSHIYLAPTALRLLIQHGDDWVKKYDISSLRVLGCGKFYLLSVTNVVQQTT